MSDFERLASQAEQAHKNLAEFASRRIFQYQITPGSTRYISARFCWLHNQSGRCGVCADAAPLVWEGDDS